MDLYDMNFGVEISLLYFFHRARTGGNLRMLQSDWLQERAVFSDLARRQRNPGVMSLLCIRG